MSKTPISPSQIPTIAALYASGKLVPSSSQPRMSPSAHLNNRISIYRGDITALRLDAIVNAANTRMLGGGGVDGAIHAAAGPGLKAECATHPEGANGRCPTGEARITGGHDLPAKHVIHAVGPDCNRIRDKVKAQELLTSVYDNILKTAADNDVKTLGICGISTAIFAYPPMDACNVACERVRRFMERDEGKGLERVVFVTFSPRDVEAYDTVLPKWFPPVE